MTTVHNHRKSLAATGLLIVTGIVLTGCSSGTAKLSSSAAASTPGSSSAAASTPGSSSAAASTPGSSSAASAVSSAAASNIKSGKAYRVYALLPQGTDQPYGTTYLPAMQAEAKKDNITLTITNSQYDASKQASDCQVAVAAKADLIILWPAVGDTVLPCLKAAKAANIPVTVTNSPVPAADVPYTRAFSGPDTYGQGVASAQIMCSITNGKPTGILEVNGQTGNSTAINRRAGFQDTVKKSCPNVHVLAEQPGNWDKDISQTVTSEMLTSVGASKVQGIYAADDTTAAGAIAALQAQGINPKPLFITAIGNTKLGNPLLKSGLLDGTVFQSSSWDGRNAIVVAYKVLTGQPVSANWFMPSVKVTIANASDPSVAPEW